MLEGTCLSTVVETLSKFPTLESIHICIYIASCNTAQEQPTEGNQPEANEDNPRQEPSASIDDAQGDCEDVEGPRVEAHVCLTQTKRKFTLKFNWPSLFI